LRARARERRLRVAPAAAERHDGRAVPGLRYLAREIVLQRGEMLVCFTDGATEAQNSAGEEFSEERLLAVVARHAGDPLESLLDTVRGEVTQFTGRDVLEDDCTLLALRRP
jgi:sigma-B regulation protein RsbU (phosphoserine phosphatase)